MIEVLQMLGAVEWRELSRRFSKRLCLFTDRLKNQSIVRRIRPKCKGRLARRILSVPPHLVIPLQLCYASRLPWQTIHAYVFKKYSKA